jgi:hypothetical protein
MDSPRHLSCGLLRFGNYDVKRLTMVIGGASIENMKFDALTEWRNFETALV